MEKGTALPTTTKVLVGGLVGAVALFLLSRTRRGEQVIQKTLAAADEWADFTAKERAILATLSDRFRPIAIGIVRDARRAGLKGFFGKGYRSPAHSDTLYAAYRAGKGPKAAPGGKSAHNFREGLDFNLTRDGAIIPLASDPAYAILRRIVERHGAVSGVSFDDGPHIEHKAWRAHRLAT